MNMPTTKKYSLPRDFATKWVAALRSGEYKQGTKKLGNKYEGYCCLGLGCIVAGAADGELNGFTVIFEGLVTEGMRPEIYERIPKELVGGYNDNDLARDLMCMNDGGTDFPQIADWIEENVEFV